MSQTPLDPSKPAAKKDEDPFAEGRKRLFQMIEEGKSWSGRERNCCFLNTGSGQFANISAVSGFDHLDDARGLALVDWDHDGDVDLWMTNRTAPRVRVMRNDTPSGHHFLAVRLEGTTTNRDAIGARAELAIEGGQHKLVKTVRAGEGFLAQSTKWLHFGLGDASRVGRLTVRWPDGKSEQFDGLDADTRYWIVQGTGTARVWAPPARRVQLVASQPTLPPVTSQAAVRLPTPVPLPTLQYTSFDGRPAMIADYDNKPVLVNLWASWCLPCAAELADFKRHAEELQAAGLDVLTLSIDGLGEDKATTPQDAEKLLARLNLPFASGVATVGLLDKLQIIHDELFAVHRALPVPTSILIDARGHLAAIYKGPVSVERLMADVALLSQDRQAWHLAALPFAGRWQHQPQRSLTPLVTKFFEHGYTDEAIDYILQNKPRLATEEKFSKMLHRVGEELGSRGDWDAAIAQFREALALNADDFQAHNNLGVAFRSQGKVDQAIRHFRRAVELGPDDADVHTNLAMALQSQGKLGEVVDHLRRAAELRPDDAAAQNAFGGALMLAGRTGEAGEHLRRALQLQPDFVIAHKNMAILLIAQGATGEAIAHWREVVRIEPDHGTAHALLGRALHAEGKADEAIEQFRHAARLLPNRADVYDALGTLLAQQQRWDAAIEAFAEAVRLKPDEAEYRRNLAAAQAKKSESGAQ